MKVSERVPPQKKHCVYTDLGRKKENEWMGTAREGSEMGTDRKDERDLDQRGKGKNGRLKKEEENEEEVEKERGK